MYRAMFLAVFLCTPLIGGEHGSDLSQLKWLAGTWQGKMWGGVFTAHYSVPSHGTVLGYSELKRDGKLALYEFERIHDTRVNVLYTPYPRGQKKETFRRAQAGKQSIVFENPKKDFPTRITFSREKDTLTITLSEIEGDKRQVFLLERRGAGDK